MKKTSFSAILFIIAWALFGETVMIETVDRFEFADLEEESQNVIIQMETGVMDALFDGGHLFFNMFTVNGNLDPALGRKSLDQAKRAGAGWFLRLRLAEAGVDWWFYKLSDFTLLGEGIVNQDDIAGSDDMTREEFFFEAGKSAGMGILAYMNR